MSDNDSIIQQLLRGAISTPRKQPQTAQLEKEDVLHPFSLVVYLGRTDICRQFIESNDKVPPALYVPLQKFLDQPNPRTGLTSLHLAIGTNNLPMTKLLVESGASFIPDAS